MFYFNDFRLNKDKFDFRIIVQAFYQVRYPALFCKYLCSGVPVRSHTTLNSGEVARDNTRVYDTTWGAAARSP